jgi:outer membrane protein
MFKAFSLVWCILMLHCILPGQNVLTLDEAIKIGLENNYAIKLAQNASMINTSNNTMGNAGMLPVVALNFGQTFNINNTKQEFFSGDKREGNNVNTNVGNANIQANWTVFNGMQMFINKDRLDALQNIGMLQLQFQIETITAQIMAQYFDIEQQEKRIDIIKEAINISKERIQLAKVRESLGSGSGLAIIQAEVDINADSSLLIQQQLVLKNMKVGLNELLVRSPDTDFKTQPSPDFKPLSLEELLSSTMTRNKLLEIAEKNIALANLNIKQREANKYPTLDINAGYNFSRLNAEIGILKFNQNAGVSFGLTGRWNIFNGFNNKREIQIAKLDAEAQKINKDNTINSLKSDLTIAYNIYNNANAMEIMEQKNINLAKKNLEITTERLKSGSITPIELRQAQQNLIDVQFRKITAAFNAKTAMLELQRLSGALLQ